MATDEPTFSTITVDKRTYENLLLHNQQLIDNLITYQSMVREAIELIFGPIASLESMEGTLLIRGPEPHHDAEAVIEALQRVKAHIDNLKR